MIDQISIEKTYIIDAETKGKAEGRAEGKNEEKESIVCNAYKKVKDVAFIAEITSLTNDQVAEILKRQDYSSPN